MSPITNYHAKFLAHALLRRSPSDSVEKFGNSLLNASVDLNPHQIDAALFAFSSPLSRGAILADEVGLGKTIEAGLIVSQLWAERKRFIVAIVPTTLRSQWVQELGDKFFIPSLVLDSRVWAQQLEAGNVNPFVQMDRVVICSYHFARAQQEALRSVPWDLVVVDEAHRLRNVYKPGSRIARAIKDAVQSHPKLLLTATPLQNSLLELYGLVGVLDDHVFGSMAAFRNRYLQGPLTPEQVAELKRRIASVCRRTLRRQVVEYVRYTRRIPITQDFTPTDEEQRLYDGVSSYLLRDKLRALPSGQRKLMTLVLRRLLASSSYAIAGTLRSLLGRLEGKRQAIESDLREDFESLPEIEEEWTGEEDDAPTPVLDAAEADKAELESEIAELTGHKDLATSITKNAKGEALLVALRQGFEKLAALAALRKAVIFTESRRTQEYLWNLLQESGYAGQVMTLNGTNTDRRATEIFEAWRRRHAGSPLLTGSKQVDLRAALIDHFRNEASVLVATEAAAEGVNLQFCSLVVNYDLPWNPQRIEQRIGRCHRYGQKHDVVVINFLNRRNEADQRVFQILSEKFQLFDGVFGASDEVLGALESGVDFEKRIAAIYQSCRTPTEIDSAFDALQAELGGQIQAQLATTRAQLLENFDEEVTDRLRVKASETQAQVDRTGRWLWLLTRHELRDHARFDDEIHRFELRSAPDGVPAATGPYVLASPGVDAGDAHLYRPAHALAQWCLARGKAHTLPSAEVVFEYSGHAGRVSLVEALVGQHGWLRVAQVSIDSLEREDHLSFGAVTDDGLPVDLETCWRLFGVGGRVAGPALIPQERESAIKASLDQEQALLLARIADKSARFFEEELEKLDRWADDLKTGLEQELRELDTEIRAAKKDARVQATLERKVAAHRRVKELEADRARRRKSLFEAQDEVDSRKESLIAEIEGRLGQKVETSELFTIRWRVE